MPPPLGPPSSVAVTAPPPASELPLAAAPEPILVPATRGWGPFASFCASLAHVEFDSDLLDEVRCEDEDYPEARPHTDAVLAAPEPPFDEAHITTVHAMQFGGLVGAQLLAARVGHDWYVFVIAEDEGDGAGTQDAVRTSAANLRIERSGTDARVVYDASTTTERVTSWAREDDRDEPPRPAEASQGVVTCAMADGALACAYVETGRTHGGDAWSVTPTLEAGDVVRLAAGAGEVPADLALERPRQLVFADAGRTRARTLSNRCHRLSLAGDLAGAETACRAALGEDPSAEEQGAIHYDLGRVAESRGDVEAARAAYARSLEVRPGNAVVRQRLAALPAAP